MTRKEGKNGWVLIVAPHGLPIKDVTRETIKCLARRHTRSLSTYFFLVQPGAKPGNALDEMLGKRDLDALEAATREHDGGRQPSRSSAHDPNPLQLLNPCVAHGGPEDIAVECGTAKRHGDVLGRPPSASPERRVPPRDVRGLVRRCRAERERAHSSDGEAVSNTA